MPRKLAPEDEPLTDAHAAAEIENGHVAGQEPLFEVGEPTARSVDPTPVEIPPQIMDAVVKFRYAPDKWFPVRSADTKTVRKLIREAAKSQGWSARFRPGTASTEELQFKVKVTEKRTPGQADSALPTGE